jgi:ATP-binding cassette subfamily F protein 3
MRHALSMALQDYAGALIVVSHDRHLIRSVADVLWLVADGRVAEFDGDLEDYASLSMQSATPTEQGELAESGNGAESRRARKRAEADRRNRLSPFRLAVREQEEEIARLVRARGANDSTLADTLLYQDGRQEDLKRALVQRAELARALVQAEARWLTLTEALERAEQSD